MNTSRVFPEKPPGVAPRLSRVASLCAQFEQLSTAQKVAAAMQSDRFATREDLKNAGVTEQDLYEHTVTLVAQSTDKLTQADLDEIPEDDEKQPFDGALITARYVGSTHEPSVAEFSELQDGELTRAQRLIANMMRQSLSQVSAPASSAEEPKKPSWFKRVFSKKLSQEVETQPAPESDLRAQRIAKQQNKVPSQRAQEFQAIVQQNAAQEQETQERYQFGVRCEQLEQELHTKLHCKLPPTQEACDKLVTEWLTVTDIIASKMNDLYSRTNESEDLYNQYMHLQEEYSKFSDSMHTLTKQFPDRFSQYAHYFQEQASEEQSAASELSLLTIEE